MNPERKVSLGYLVFKSSKVSDESPHVSFQDPLIPKEQTSNLSNFSIDTMGPLPVKKSFNWRRMFANPIPTPRKVYLSGRVIPVDEQSNMIKNSKYNVLTFLPLVLYEQFHQFINIFYLGLTISQFIPILRVGFLIDYLGPLALVVILSLLKELYDDIQRHQRDRQINSQRYNIVTSSGLQPLRGGELKVGHIVEVKSNERIPADLVILYAEYHIFQNSDEQGNVFIRTDQLDGETDWKLRKAVKMVQQDFQPNIPEELIRWDAAIDCAAPIENIYDFKGLFVCQAQKESLSLENVAWASTVLANGRIFGLIIHAGRETRMAMNSRQPKTKRGLLDQEVNWTIVKLFLLMIILSAIVTFFSQEHFTLADIPTKYVRYFVLLSNIIPISMRVNMEFAKLVYSYKINKDKEIEGTITRNSNIPESLGRIQYLLTDKTGTLTQNDMIFKKISLEQNTFTDEDLSEMIKIIRDQMRITSAPMNDIFDQSGNLLPHKGKARLRRERDSIFKDLILSMSLCHNVTPTMEDGVRSFQASSPDEIALVKICEVLGIKLAVRDQTKIILEDKEGRSHQFSILNNFPFSSETKRMGVIVRHEETQRYIFYLKGADQVMKQFINETQRGFIDEECENLAREGLRTLVMTQRLMSQRDYEKWANLYKLAQETLEAREQACQKVIGYLENNMEFLGITGVEDKLQEDVCMTLENCRNGGINVWMLTGDKVETAICIAISSGIKSADQEIFLIKECVDEIKLQNLLAQYESLNTNHLMVIDGTSLATALRCHEQYFFQVATQAVSVVCCRCSPTQKARVTECIRFYTKKVVACIGDGGNDVGMIQQADVGIGIEGKEGKQAALASDFSILKFKYLNILLFWHGRLSYKRSAMLAQFVIHRGLIISFIQMSFMFIYYFLSISVFSGELMLGYSTIYTNFPVFAIIFDEDVEKNIALKYPPLYRSLQKGRDLNSKTFLIWVWKSIYQGVIIITIAILLFKKSIFIQLETVAFTALIFTEYAMTLSELNSIHIVMIVANISSACVYIGTLYLFPAQLNVSQIDLRFILYVLIILALSWGPLFIAKLILKKIQPSDYEKIMKSVKRKAINTQIFS